VFRVCVFVFVFVCVTVLVQRQHKHKRMQEHTIANTNAQRHKYTTRMPYRNSLQGTTSNKQTHKRTKRTKTQPHTRKRTVQTQAQHTYTNSTEKENAGKHPNHAQYRTKRTQHKRTTQTQRSTNTNTNTNALSFVRYFVQ